MSNFAFTDETHRAVWRSNADGNQESYLVTAPEFQVWLAAGGVPDPYIAPIEPQSVLSQDLMAQFTADDAAKIQAAVSGNVQFWLLWSSLQAQKDPMFVNNPRFLAGWGALVSVLGQPRMDAIAAALGVTVA